MHPLSPNVPHVAPSVRCECGVVTVFIDIMSLMRIDCVCDYLAGSSAARARLADMNVGVLGIAFAEECSKNIEASTQVRQPSKRKTKPRGPVPEKVEITDETVGKEGEEDGQSDDIIVLESMHPHPSKYTYSGVVYLKGASAMRIVIDRRTYVRVLWVLVCPAHVNLLVCLGFPTQMDPARAKLTIYGDSNMHSVVKVITVGEGEAPFVIHSDTIAYKFHDNVKGPGAGWGFRVVISPIWSLQWLREEQVLTSPSLEWGMWLMYFLMSEAPDVAATGALHHRLIFDSLVRYLKSPALPYKSRVIALLSQLLSSHHLFKSSAMPNLRGNTITDLCCDERFLCMIVCVVVVWCSIGWCPRHCHEACTG